MHKRNIPNILSATALTIITSSYAIAQDPGWYVGANIGRSKAHIDETPLISSTLGGGLLAAAISNRDRDTGYKVFGGYQFNHYFAMESGYFDLGTFNYSRTELPMGSLSGNAQVKGVNFDIIGIIPFTERFSALGRVGVNYAEVQNKYSGTGLVYVLNPSDRKRESNLKLGAGLQYDFTKTFGMRAEAERYRVSGVSGRKADIDLVSVGLVFRFNRPISEPDPLAEKANVEPTPEPVIEKTPVLIVVPVQSPTQQYCTILDIQFEVNQEAMQREEKEKLAVIGTFLTKYPDTTAVIEGHTDNAGTAEHNMELSRHRAESAVAYLTDNYLIAPDRLTAVGYGDTRPLASNDTEAGKRQNRRIDAVVACVTDVEGLKVAPARVTMAMVVEFDQNKADIKPKYDADLHKVATFLKTNPNVTATVEGHTGNLQVTPALAMEISRRRAQNVVDYLVQNFGIERSRLTAEGFGRNRRFAYNTSQEGQQENRRINIILNYPD